MVTVVENGVREVIQLLLPTKEGRGLGLSPFFLSMSLGGGCHE
jgi:hypothetical protein